MSKNAVSYFTFKFYDAPDLQKEIYDSPFFYNPTIFDSEYL